MALASGGLALILQPVKLFACLALVFGLVLHASAQTSDAPLHLSKPAVRAELVAVVTTQLAAFRADDWERAYQCAARTFQAQVPLDDFITLVSTRYAVVWKNTRAEFGIPSDNGVRALVTARVFSEKGSEPYVWILAKEGGQWKITGVVPQPRNEG